jgi:flavin-dependent dehydrogenase
MRYDAPMKTHPLPAHVDLLVLGLGSAGAAAAALGARRGLRVLALDKRPLAEAGARWVNGVPRWCFAEAGLAPPGAPERRGGGGPAFVIAGHGPQRIEVDASVLDEVDMRALVVRLQGEAREAGADLRGGVRVRRLAGHDVVTDAGTVRAAAIIDASGRPGGLTGWRPRVGRAHVCVAAQQVHALADRAGAEAFWARHRAPLGQVLSFTGVHGGFSLMSARLHDGQVALLTGSVPGAGHPPGQVILRRFLRDNPWVGERLFGGAGPIPLRRPLDRLAVGPVALIGDAACQVFPAHGSGVGAGMVAAATAVGVLAEGGAPHDYAVAWQRRWGGLFAAYDLFRRYSQTLAPATVARLMTTGLLDPVGAQSGLAQRFPTVPLTSLPGKARGALREPRLVAGFARLYWQMLRVRAHYARYPAEESALPAWSAAAGRLFGDAPDVVAGTRAT